MKNTFDEYIKAVNGLEEEHPGIRLVVYHVFKGMQSYSDEQRADAVGDAVLKFLTKEPHIDKSKGDGKAWLTAWIIDSIQQSRRHAKVVTQPKNRETNELLPITVTEHEDFNDTRTYTPEMYDGKDKVFKKIRNLVDGMIPEHRAVVEGRYGFNGDGMYPTQERLSEKLGCSRQNVHQILNVARKRLKGRMIPFKEYWV